MGTVYEAEDADGRVVAVKTLATYLSDDVGLRRRFEAEIEALKALRHPGIVRLLAFGEEDGLPFFAMELVPGRSLEDLLKNGRIYSWQETIATATAITRALKAAHDQGIVHRDLKPANLLFADASAADGGVKLADFGIARLFGETGQTQAGTVVGTAEYMAPEQATGAAIDHRADLYALGLVMYAMLTGKPPFRGAQVLEVLVRQRREAPPRVSTVASNVPPALDALIDKLLAKKADERPASALAVGRLLETIEREADPPATATGPASGATVRSDRAPTGVDLLAKTRGTLPAQVSRDATRRPATVPGPGPGPGGNGATEAFVAPTEIDAGSLAHRATEADPSLAEPRRAAATRFTTVADLDRSMREEAARQAGRETLIKAVVGVVLVTFVVVIGYVVTRPVSADTLHARIMTIAENPSADLRDAKRSIDTFLERFSDDVRADPIRELAHRLDLDALERRTRRRLPKSQVPTAIERDYRAAMARESESPLACVAALEAILAIHQQELSAAQPGSGDDASLWLALVRRQIDRLTPLATSERKEDAARASATLKEAAILAAQAKILVQADRETVLARRHELLAGLVEMYADRPHVASAVAEARRLLASPD
jgi:serine/threonine-protein kinase